MCDRLRCVARDIIDFSAYSSMIKNLAFHKVTLVVFPHIQVSLPDAEVKAGLALLPQALEVSLVDRPLTDLLFTQFMASVSGKVYCLGTG